MRHGKLPNIDLTCFWRSWRQAHFWDRFWRKMSNRSRTSIIDLVYIRAEFSAVVLTLLFTRVKLLHFMTQFSPAAHFEEPYFSMFLRKFLSKIDLTCLDRSRFWRKMSNRSRTVSGRDRFWRKHVKSIFGSFPWRIIGLHFCKSAVDNNINDYCMLLCCRSVATGGIVLSRS